ncbi:MAG: 4Fe-4S double cluster binding domain-containing protein [Planctomycetota bacterium]|jgi:epoxyqueuosine reductase QueG
MTDAELFAELQRFLANRGATLVACADLGPLPAEVRQGLPLGISIGAALSPSIVAGIVDGPTEQYASEYLRVNALLSRLAEDAAALLRGRGFRAVANKVTVDKLDLDTLATTLPHKTVATRAGLGWIGKCALLVNERYGSAVRYNTVLTDAPLPVGTPVEASACAKCTACVEACPAGAPLGRDWQPDQPRASFFDAFACYRTAQESTRRIGIANIICGICIAVCPYTKRYTDERGDAAGA